MNSQASRPHTALALEPSAQVVLRALFQLALADCPADAGSVARLLGLRASQVAQALVELDVQGLVDAERARLTMRGLAVAAGLPAITVPENEARPALRQGLALHRQPHPAELSSASGRELRHTRVARRAAFRSSRAEPRASTAGRRTIRASHSAVSL
ncbi:MAG: hypothetical protein QM778_25935 [Myxococcales bacterium]